MIGLLLWLALTAADIAVMAAILWIERTFAVPQVTWLGTGNFLIFGTLLMAVDIAIFMKFIRKYGPQQRRDPGMLKLVLRVGWYLSIVVGAAVIGLQSSERIERFFAIVVVVSGVFSMYASVQDVIKRHRERWT
jgi:uncharacterized membrane protein YfcA